MLKLKSRRSRGLLMTDPAGIREIYAALLSTGRTTQERLASLQVLQNYLGDEDVALMLGSMARGEKTQEIRAAMLRMFLNIDITRFTKKEAYLEYVFFFAVSDAESTLRLAAVGRLAGLVTADPRIQDLLTESLLGDLSEEIQGAALTGLVRCTRLTGATVKALVEYAGFAPAGLREQLLDLFGRMERADCEQGLLVLLQPMERVALRANILNRLMAFPVISAPVARHLVAYLPKEPDSGLQEQIVKILFNGIQADTGLLQTILDQVRASQDQRALLYAFRDRLFSFPVMVEGLRQLFTGATSTSLKIDILKLLEPTESIAFFTAALFDSGPWVRFQAIGICDRRMPGHEAEIRSAVVARIPQEPLPGLRENLVRLLGKTGRKSPEVERFLVRWIVMETNPAIAEQIAAILPGIAMTDDNRQDLLSAYVKVMREPFYSAEVKDVITSKLTAFSFQDHPDLAECLKALLVRATDIRTVETLHNSLRTLEPDPAKNIDLIRLLFLRFIGDYATEPLPGWVRDFEALAPVNERVRREIPYIVRLTGATWILDTADVNDQKDNLLPAILDAIDKSTFHEPERLLQKAYEARTLRKRDLTSLYLHLLNYNDQYSLLNNVIRILVETRICSPEILDASFRFITTFSDSNAAYGVKSYLEEIGPSEPSYPDRVRNAMTPENYRIYGLTVTEPRDENRMPEYWDDSGHWRLPYPGWPVADLFFSFFQKESIRYLLLSPLDPSVPALESFHYLLLHHLWQSDKLSAEDLAAIGRLMQSSKLVTGYEVLFERAVFTFSNSWPSFVEELGKNPIPAGLAAYAGEAFAEQCRQWQGLGIDDPVLLPMPLIGMDLKQLETALDPGDAAWDQLWTYYGSFLASTSNEKSWPQLARVVLHLRFFPVNDVFSFIRFLVLTPVPEEAVWEKHWRDLLQNANHEHGSTVTKAIAQLPESRRKRLLSFMT
jgi:hypothetical protein